MVKKAIILDDAWFDDEVRGGEVLVRVEVPERRIYLFLMGNEGKQVRISFEELKAIQALVEEARQEWGDPTPEAEADET